MSLCLWAVNLTSVSDFFYFPIGGIEWLLWAWVGYFPSSRSVGGGSSLMNPQEVRFWLTHFSWGQILLKTECPDVFKNDSFSPTLLEARVHSPNPSLLHLPRSLWKPGRAPPGKIHTVSGPWCLDLPGVCPSQTCPHWASANHQSLGFLTPGLTTASFLPKHVVFLYTSRQSLQSGGNSLPCDLTTLKDRRRAGGFRFLPVLKMKWCLSASYLPGQKPEVSNYIFHIIFLWFSPIRDKCY